MIDGSFLRQGAPQIILKLLNQFGIDTCDNWGFPNDLRKSHTLENHMDQCQVIILPHIHHDRKLFAGLHAFLRWSPGFPPSYTSNYLWSTEASHGSGGYTFPQQNFCWKSWHGILLLNMEQEKNHQTYLPALIRLTFLRKTIHSRNSWKNTTHWCRMELTRTRGQNMMLTKQRLALELTRTRGQNMMLTKQTGLDLEGLSSINRYASSGFQCSPKLLTGSQRHGKTEGFAVFFCSVPTFTHTKDNPPKHNRKSLHFGMFGPNKGVALNHRMGF